MKNRSLLAALLAVTTVTTTVVVNALPSYGQAQHLPRLGAKILPWIKGMGIIGGAMHSTHQGVQAAETRLNKCPNSGGKFDVPVDAWVGGTSGFWFGYSSYQTVEIWYPNNTRARTQNVFEFQRNKWIVIPNTPYAFCVNGKDGIVEARFEPRG